MKDRYMLKTAEAVKIYETVKDLPIISPKCGSPATIINGDL